MNAAGRRKIRRACKEQRFQPEHVTKLKERKRMSMHPSDVARLADIPKEAEETPDPMAGFADEAENRLDQDLKLLSSGHRTRVLLRRLKQYKNFIAETATTNLEFAQKYKQRT